MLWDERGAVSPTARVYITPFLPDLSAPALSEGVALDALGTKPLVRREPVGLQEGSLVKRIRRLLYLKTLNGVWSPLAAAVVLMAIVAVTLAAWQAPRQKTGAAQSPLDRATTSPYERWLNEDVVYIVADEERAVFQKLATDPERGEFIRQFWLRRVTAGKSEEQIKEEHYRRIAYANERFRAPSGRPGWQTDRGHMYIVYGPADEIDETPAIRFWGGASRNVPPTRAASSVKVG